MKNIKLQIIVLFCFGIFCIQSGYPQLKTTEIDTHIDDAMEKFGVTGMAVGIIKDGQIIHSKGYGLRSLKNKKPVDEHTRFAIASNTKAFTTTALAMLVDEGKLDWNDKVSQYIPEFKMQDPYITANFTITDLLCHRSGLGLGAGDLMFFPDGSDFTLKDVLQSFQYQKSVSDFRTEFAYNNLMYIVAGEIVSRVSGMSWCEFIETKIMTPIGMEESACSYADISKKANIADPFTYLKNETKTLDHFDVGIAKPAGGIYSNIQDMLKWLSVHLNGGKYQQTQMISLENHIKMWTPHTQLAFNPIPKPPYRVHFSSYGLGWSIFDLNGYVLVGHTGGLPGMLSQIILVPEMNLGVIVLTNTTEGGAYAHASVIRTVVDNYLGLSDFKWTEKLHMRYEDYLLNGDSVSTAVWKEVNTNKKPNIAPSNLLGNYEDPWFGQAKIFMKKDQLWMQFIRSPKLNGALQYYKGNTYAIKWEYQDVNADAFAIFELNEEGNAHAIKMKGISPNIDFSFDFHHLDLQRIPKE